MLYKTQGIVLHHTKYNDNNYILDLFTEEFGKVSYIIYNPNSKRAKVKSSYIQPFSILDIEVEHHPKKDIQQIKEAKVQFFGNNILSNPIKSSIVLFLSEVLYKCLSETEKDTELFSFVKNSILALEQNNTDYANFHLVFLLQLTQFFGFYPNTKTICEGAYFDMLNGVFCGGQPSHNHYLKRSESEIFYELLQVDYTTMERLKIGRAEKQVLLRYMMEFYELHLQTLHKIKSLDVLQAIFN